MKKPVEINLEQIKREIRQNRSVYQITEERIAALINVLEILKSLVAKAAGLLIVDICVLWEAQIRLCEVDLAKLRLQQVQQDEIHTALQQLLEVAESRFVVPE